MTDELGAFCRHSHVALAGQPTGPLAGLSMGVKDVFDIAGYKTGNGHPEWYRTHEPAPATASAVSKLLAAGASLIGRTHTDELAYSLNGENIHFGTPVNPRAPGRIPGGSSSGSASAVSGGLVDFALGTDCGGSVRLPASYCGIYGIRPTDGRIADDGIIHLAKSFDTVGWFARTPTLLAQVDAVLSGEDGDPVMPREALIASDAFDLARDSVVTALLPALDRVSSAVRSTRTIQIGTDRLRGWMQDFRVIQGAEVWANHREWVLSVRPTFGPGIKERFEWAATIATEAVETATEHRRALAAEMQDLLGDGAVLLIPTAPDIAPRLNTPPTELERFRADALSLLCVAGLAGLPQINLPLGVVQGCPIGLSIVGSRGSDRALLALATQLGS